MTSRRRFALAELAARIQALCCRTRPAKPRTLERGGIILDPHRQTVTRDGQPIGLSRKEFAVLTELLRAEGGVVAAEMLPEKAWEAAVTRSSIGIGPSGQPYLSRPPWDGTFGP